jgi:uncharacterized protein (TIGR01777 family)
MHHLITGGSGFIGSALCRGLVADGHRVTVLTRDVARAKSRVPAGVALVEELDVAAAVDVVVNLAGENLSGGRWNAARKRAFVDSRIGMTRRVVGWIAAQEPRPRVLVSGSAIGWYGARGDEELGEDAAPGADFAARMTLDWEAEACKAEALGLRVCRIRTGIVLAAHGGALKQMLLPFRLGLGGPMGGGRQWMSWIALDDEVALIRWLIDNQAAAGAYNGTAPAPVRNAGFAKALGRALHRPAVLRAPAFALQLLLGEMSGLVLTGQRVLPRHALAQGFTFRYPELAGALAHALA